MKLQHNSRRGDPMLVVSEPCSERFCPVYIDGPLLAPVNQELATRVRVLLQRGERRIVLDLSSVSLIDAAGVGVLVRAYNVACAMDASLRIAHATKRVREILTRVGLFDLLSADGARGFIPPSPSPKDRLPVRL